MGDPAGARRCLSLALLSPKKEGECGKCSADTVIISIGGRGTCGGHRGYIPRFIVMGIMDLAVVQIPFTGNTGPAVTIVAFAGPVVVRRHSGYIPGGSS